MPAPTINSADTLIFARWIIPVTPASTPLSHYAIAINDGVISAILPATEAQAITAKEILHLDHHAVMPGLINAHGHAAMSLFRGMADDKALHTWLNDHIWPAEGQWVNADFVRDGSKLAIAEMLRSGTTTFSDMYFFPEVTAQVARKAGIPTHERRFSLTDVYSAEEAFVTGTFAGVAPVGIIDGRTIGTGQRGFVTERLQGLYKAFIDADCARSCAKASRADA